MARLTEQEKQDIVRYLEADKPLPDKYRFMLFEEKREVELVWNGKSNEVCNIVLPFQVIEQVDEPRSEKNKSLQMGLFDMDARGRQLKGWTNKLIWGDNKLILSSLKNGPLREEIEKQGGIKLIYIDPPFDVGADFSMDIEIGGDTFTKKPNVLEELAYRDTWGKGADSFIAMIYERLVLMRDLLAEDGSIYVHCDWRVNSYLRLILDEIFGNDNFRNEIIWKRTSNPKGSQFGINQYGISTDSLFWYSKSDEAVFNIQDVKRKLTEEEIKEKYNLTDEKGRYYPGPVLRSPSMGARPNLVYEYKGYTPGFFGWRMTKNKLIELDNSGNLGWSSTGQPFRKLRPNDDEGFPIFNLWDDINRLYAGTEFLNYPTQKPEALLKRIIKASSKEGDGLQLTRGKA
jgi:adenine-specific DNA-methyltransferase